MDLFDRHARVVLQFSGGKDSLACLYLCRAYWSRITVLWVNTGDAFPETKAQMAVIRGLVPDFVEVRANQPGNIREAGFPVDVVPAWASPLGRLLDSKTRLNLQSPLECCARNIWAPMYQATHELGATAVIRGQRNGEQRKAIIRSGHREDGIEYCFPLEDWSNEKVAQFLRAEGVDLPVHYTYTDTSLDCMHCTAYLDENVGKFHYIRVKHPGLHVELQERLSVIKASLDSEMRFIELAMEA